MSSGKEQIRILIVDDEQTLGLTMLDYFSVAGDNEIEFLPLYAKTAEKALELFSQESIDVVLLDIQLGDYYGIDILREMKNKREKVEIILLTGYGSKELTIEALNEGAHDFLSKPLDLNELEKIVLKAYEKKVLQEEHRNIHQKSKIDSIDKHQLSFIGEAPEIKEIMNLISNISSIDCNVLIQGESGTGKELIARLIHQNSSRSKKVFFPVNCGAIPENLLESELFGFEKGAFTGANNRKPGLFEVAGQGTLFLDEIGELPLNFQVKLLRVLETGEYHRVGGTEILKTHARILSASNKELKQEVEKGLFRQDLYYRLNVITLSIPPLRERPKDIKALTNYFIEQQCRKLKREKSRISKEAMQLLESYHWPGNARELQNLIDRIIILNSGSLITPESVAKNLSLITLKPKTNKDHLSNSEYLPLVKKNELVSLSKLDEIYIRYILEHVHFNKSQAANILNISERTLYRKIKEYKL